MHIYIFIYCLFIIYLFIYLSIYLSIYPSIYLFICLSIYLFIIYLESYHTIKYFSPNGKVFRTVFIHYLNVSYVTVLEFLMYQVYLQ